MSSPSETLVLVTGGSGFIGSWCVVELLKAGYKVRATVRNLEKVPAIKASLKNGDLPDSALERLSWVAADLGKDDGWKEALEGCTYCHHVASPFFSHVPKDENEMIIPARDGALRVLKAAKAAGVKRVVMTSSFAAIGYGHPVQAAPFTEETWTDVNHSEVGAYEKSKTIAERAAWDFVKSPEGQGLELSVVNPVAVLGPVLSGDFSPSILLVQRLLTGDMPGCPNINFGIVDVRDVISLHLLAMIKPEAAGERFLAISPPAMSILEISLTLKERLPALSKKSPTMKIPDWVLRIVSLWDPAVKLVANTLSKKKDATNEKAKRLLGWEPRSKEDAIVACAESLVKLGLLKK